jgi:hypothetical protein
MRFTFSVTGWHGLVHDTRVWTDARPRFPNYPHPPPGNHFAYVYVCMILDHKYLYYILTFGTCRKILSCWLWISKQNWLSRPIQRATLSYSGLPRSTSVQEKFNHFHSSLRNAIERAFGILKMKWRILLSILHFHDLLMQTKIISACMCLHNFICDSKLFDDHFDQFECAPYVHEDSASFTSWQGYS